MTKRSSQDPYDTEARLAFLRSAGLRIQNREVYVHYKGGVYLVLGGGRHTETEEELVAYTHLWPHHDSRWWFRPHEMFHDIVNVDGGFIKRFEKVDFDAL